MKSFWKSKTMIPGAVVVGGLAFLGGYQEVLGNRVAGGLLIVPLSCAAGAGVGALISDYLLDMKAFGDTGNLISDMFHSFLWALVANWLVDTLRISNGLLISSAAGGVGAYYAHMGGSFPGFKGIFRSAGVPLNRG